jgi:serine/threonine protein kinase
MTVSKSPILAEVAVEFASQRGLGKPSFEGKGAFKETYGVVTARGDRMALKLTDPEKCNLARTEREIKSLLKCNTPLVGKLYDYGLFHSPANGKDYYFSLEEFLDGGTLTDKMAGGNLTPEIVRRYTVVLVKAIDYLRSISIVHRDIKPDNIMFRSGVPDPVLVDLGLARDLGETSLTPSWLASGPGTPYYSAPEQLNNEKRLIDWRTDQFCLGVVIGICLTGWHPFAEEGMTPPETVAAVAERRPCTARFRRKAEELAFAGLPKMLEPWPIRRFQSIEELLRCLET